MAEPEPLFPIASFRASVITYADALAHHYRADPGQYDNKKSDLIARCTTVINQRFADAWMDMLAEGQQDGGRRHARRTRHRRRNISDMSWLRRRVNSLSLRNLQREENRLSEEEDHEMPGRGWARAKKARKTRRRI